MVIVPLHHLKPGQSARGLSVVVGNLEERKFDMRVIAVD